MITNKIKLTTIDDIKKFFELIDSCKGEVDLVGEGLSINLKSKLAQFFSLAEIFASDDHPDLELVVHNSEDVDKLANFLIK